MNDALNGDRRPGDFLRGFALPLGPYGIAAVVAAAGLGPRAEIIAFGSWSTCLFLTRRVWVSAQARLVYRKPWLKALFWPLTLADQNSYVRMIYGFTWGWLVVGILMILSGIFY